jgi:thiol-disulfide isomerase/thioredoxin
MSLDTTAVHPKGVRERIRNSRFGTLLVLAVTAALVMGGTYLVERPSAEKAGVSAVNVTPGEGAAPKVGTPAQDFEATTVDGKKVSLSSYKGHPVWLTFGASWCAACQAEAPDIEAAYQKAKTQGAVVLAVSISEDSATVQEYASRIT